MGASPSRSAARRGASATGVEPASPVVAGAPRKRLLPYALGVLAFAVYLANLRPMGAADTIPARLLPFSILREGNLDLDEFTWLRSDDPAPYFLRQDSVGHWRSKYPIVTPLLATPIALPFVWWSRAWQLGGEDARFRLVVVIFDRVAAAGLTAASVVLVYFGARRLAPVGAAAVAALVYAFATNTWVTSSQSLWQHGVAELALAGAALCVLRKEGARSAGIAGALVGLSIGARPQSAVVALFFGLFFLVERRRDLAAFLVPPALMVTAVLAYNVIVLGRVTGGYRTSGMGLLNLTSMLGLLVSPSRGLFVYCPLAMLSLTALRRPKRDEPRVLPYLAAAIAGYVLFFACFRVWWAGYSYGPRFLCDVMPLSVLCALPAAQRLWLRPAGRVLMVAGIAWGLAVQIIGVYCDDDMWNKWPASVDARPERLWDWSDPQIVRAARSGWHGGDLAPLLWQLHTDRWPVPLQPLEWQDLQGTIEPLVAPPWHFRAGVGGRLAVRITSNGGAVWPAFSDWGDLQVGIAPMWKADGAVLKGVGDFVSLPNHLAPGATTELRRWIEAPGHAGRYDLELNLVQTLGSSGRFGGVTTTVPVIVE